MHVLNLEESHVRAVTGDLMMLHLKSDNDIHDPHKGYSASCVGVNASDSQPTSYGYFQVNPIPNAQPKGGMVAETHRLPGAHWYGPAPVVRRSAELWLLSGWGFPVWDAVDALHPMSAQRHAFDHWHPSVAHITPS